MVNSRYIDWQPIVAQMEKSNELTILELGCGAGTAFLIDNFKYVYSYETNTRDVTGRWFELTKQQHQNKNWKGFFDTTLGPNHTVDISTLIHNIKNNINLDLIDVVFVDPGFRNRAECVLEFARMNKFQYIFTHDTSVDSNVYGWKLLEHMPTTYKICSRITSGQGTTLWKKL